MAEAKIVIKPVPNLDLQGLGDKDNDKERHNSGSTKSK